MKVCVLGLWHLGTVTAACLASVGHDVVGLDFETETIRNLQNGQPPIFEPNLEALVKQGIENGNLRFTTDPADALHEAAVVWVAYDTPVDDEDRADIGYVTERIERLFAHLAPDTLVLISSQLPVGTTQHLESRFKATYPTQRAYFAYSPENLRLGNAINVFSQPDRVVIGVNDEAARATITALLAPITERIEWMSIASAEMTKHALNAFLATSMTFINEVAVLCERVGADAREVERGLKSESRIGQKAYLRPGNAFAGGTLARDVRFLNQLATDHERTLPLLSGIWESNETHKLWVQDTLIQYLGNLEDKTVAVWGLTYKPNTDTLRRSSAVELCKWLTSQGTTVLAHDPAIQVLPNGLVGLFNLVGTALDAVQNADALVVATEWAAYQQVDPSAVLSALKQPIIIDANHFLAKAFGQLPQVRYAAVGKRTLI